MIKLSRLQLRGWRSYGEQLNLAFDDVNVMIGANGAGKSNLVSFFELLSWMTTAPPQLQAYVGRSGGLQS